MLADKSQLSRARRRKAVDRFAGLLATTNGGTKRIRFALSGSAHQLFSSGQKHAEFKSGHWTWNAQLL